MSFSGLLCTYTPNSDWRIRPTDWNTPVGRTTQMAPVSWNEKEEGEDDITLLDQESEKLPWYRPTSKAAPRQDPALESFIQACTADFLDIKKGRRIKDNLTRGSKRCLAVTAQSPGFSWSSLSLRGQIRYNDHWSGEWRQEDHARTQETHTTTTFYHRTQPSQWSIELRHGTRNGLRRGKLMQAPEFTLRTSKTHTPENVNHL